ncbi:MAG TPA: extracellular solute-binding protein, partial [Limnochordia bacterium]
MTTMRRFLLMGVLCSLLVSGPAAWAAPVQIEFWHPYGPPWDAVYAKYGELFNAAYPDVHVDVKSIPDLHTKLPVAVAAGAGPDVAHVWGVANVIKFSNGVIQPLDQLLTAVPEFNPRDVFPAFLETFRYQGRLWALPTSAQPTSLRWSKQVFREAGLDEERGPATQPEFESFIRKLTRFKADGSLERAGFRYGMWGGFFNWAYHWGGSFYDAQAHRFTAAAPINVAALEWVLDLNEQLGGLSNLNTLVGAAPGNPIYDGRLAMETASHYHYYLAYQEAPDFEYGFSIIPPLGPASARPKGPVVHTDAHVVVAGSDRPVEAARFVFYTTLGPGALERIKLTGHPSASIATDRLATERELVPEWYPMALWQQNFEVLARARPWPLIPVLADLTSEVERAAGQAINRELSPSAA